MVLLNNKNKKNNPHQNLAEKVYCRSERTCIRFCWGYTSANVGQLILKESRSRCFLCLSSRILSPLKNAICLKDVGYCHTWLHLGFSAKLGIWQVPTCKMEPQSGYIFCQNRPPGWPPDHMDVRLARKLKFFGCLVL